MHFQIHALDPAPYAPLFDLDAMALRAHGARQGCFTAAVTRALGSA